MLCYDFDAEVPTNLDLSQLNEIINWLEGPESALRFAGLELPKDLDNAIESLNIKTIILGPYLDAHKLPKSINKVYRICTLNDGWQEDVNLLLNLETPLGNLTQEYLDQIQKLSKVKEVYLDGIFTKNDIPLISELGVEGIVVKGSVEEKIGIKSFDAIDDLLDAIFY